MLKRLLGITAALSLAAVVGRVLAQRLRREAHKRHHEVQEYRRKQPEPDQIRTELEYEANEPEVSRVVSVVEESKTPAEAPHASEDKPVDPVEVVTDTENPGVIQDPKDQPTRPAESVETERSEPKQESEVPGHSNDNAQRDRFQPSRREPLNRGGHPRESNQSEPAQNPSGTRQPDITRPRAHLCVWMEAMEWRLGVEVSHKTEQDLTVRQGDHEIEQDEFDTERWLLTGEPGAIEVLDGQDCVKRITDLAHGLVPLVFRLTGDLEHGAQVKQPTTGAFLLLVPSACDEPVFNPPHIAVDAEPVTPSTFQAYFINVEPRLALTVRIGADYEIGFRSTRKTFGLKGTLIEDAAPKSDKRSSRQGPLYAGAPPEIVNDLGWERVSSVVAIEEGTGKGRWRNSIDPTSYDSSELLSRLLNGRRTGWFTLRFYDKRSELIESFDFRYTSEINGPPQLIESDKSESKKKYDVVVIDHKPAVRIEATNTTGEIPYPKPVGDDATYLRIPYMKQYDHTEWYIVGDDTHVPLYVELPRFWRRLRIEGETSGGQWSSTPLDLQMRDFDPTAARILDVSVSPGAAQKVLIDFDLPSKRQYRTSSGGDLQIQLWDFFDARSLRCPGNHVLKFWLGDHLHSHTVELGILDVQDKCIYCEQNRSSESSVFLNHIIDNHLSDVYTDISVYSGRVTRFYHCNYCPTVYDENWTIGQTEGIEKHVKNIHGIGSPQENIHFVVSDKKMGVRQIQEHLHSYRCKSDGCDEVIEGMTNEIKEKLANHLQHCHLNALSRLA